MNNSKAQFHGTRLVRRLRAAAHKVANRKRHHAMYADQFGLRGTTRSDSRAGVVHTTHIDDRGYIRCTCEDAQYRKPNQHINDAADQLCKHGRLLRAALVDAHRLRQEVA